MNKMKSYVSPIVSFESFELSSTTASSCGVDTHLHSRNTCGLEDPSYGVIFMESMSFCETKVSGDYPICYHQLTEGNNLFNS